MHNRAVGAVLGAAVIVALFGAAQSDPNPCHGHSDRAGGRCGKGVAPNVAVATYNFSAASTGVYPPCTVAENCLALCTVGSNGNWGCTRSDGGSFGTVSQGTSPTAIQTPFNGAYARQDVTDSSAGGVVSDADLQGFFGGDHTVVMMGYGTGKTNASFQHWLGYHDGTHGIYFRHESGNFKCAYEGNAATVTTSALVPVDGWGISTCMKTGTTYSARVNGTQVDATDVDTVSTVTAGSTLWLGTRKTPSAGLPLRGPLAWVALYLEGKSDAWLKGIESKWWGVYPFFQYGNSQNLGIEHPDGGIDMYYTGAARVDDQGFRAQRGFQNKWAADSLAAATWADVGTPSVASNVMAGPWYQWGNANECDIIADDSNSAFEGKESASYGTTAYPYTASCYLGAGDAGMGGSTVTKARIAWNTDGTGATDCDFTGLTSQPVRKVCTTTIGGSPTSIKAQVLVGNATTDQGSIVVCGCNLTKSKFAEVPVPTNELKGNSVLNLDGGGFPTDGGVYELVFHLPYNLPSDWYDTTDTAYMLDVYNDRDAGGAGQDPTHSVITIFGYTAGHLTLGETRWGVGPGTAFTPDASVVANTRYATSMEWRPNGLGTGCKVWFRFNSCDSSAAITSCHATSVLAANTAGDGQCPSQGLMLRLADRFSSSFPTSSYIESFRVYQ